MPQFYKVKLKFQLPECFLFSRELISLLIFAKYISHKTHIVCQPYIDLAYMALVFPNIYILTLFANPNQHLLIQNGICQFFTSYYGNLCALLNWQTLIQICKCKFELANMSLLYATAVSCKFEKFIQYVKSGKFAFIWALFVLIQNCFAFALPVQFLLSILHFYFWIAHGK